MKLPFNKAAPFPADAFEPTPERLKQGVEYQARMNTPKVPVVNTTTSDRVAALGRNPNVPMAPQQPSLPQSAPASRPAPMAPRNPLGGMDSRPLSERGPMRGAVGEGTNNPNAVRVGPMRMPGERTLMRAARRGDTRAAGMLYGTAHENAREGRQTAIQMWRDQLDHERRTAERGEERRFQKEDAEAGRGFQAWRDAENAKRDAENRGIMRGWETADRNAEWAREDKKENAPDTITEKPINGGRQVGIFRNGKLFNVVGGEAPKTPLPPGMVPKQAERDGVIYGTPQDPKKEPPNFTFEKDEFGGIKGALYPEQGEDGKWVMKRVPIVDANNDGIPDNLQGGGGGGSGSPASVKGTGQTKSGITFKAK